MDWLVNGLEGLYHQLVHALARIQGYSYVAGFLKGTFLTCFAMITQQQVGLMHSQLQGMMFRPIQMSFRCLPIFPIGVSFGCLRCQLAAINLLAYGFASKDASRGRFRDSDCSLPPLLLDDVCCLFAYLSSCAAHPPQAWALCDVAPENSFSVLLACGWSSLYMFKYCQQFGCSGSMGGVTYIQIQRLSDSYA